MAVNDRQVEGAQLLERLPLLSSCNAPPVRAGWSSAGPVVHQLYLHLVTKGCPARSNCDYMLQTVAIGLCHVCTQADLRYNDARSARKVAAAAMVGDLKFQLMA